MKKRKRQSPNRSQNKKFNLDIRKQNIREANRVLSLTKALLVMIGDIAETTAKSFFPHPYYHAFCEHRKRSFQTTLLRLQKQGLICKEKGYGNFFMLTRDGEQQRNSAIKRVIIEAEKNEKWDGKWRVLVFDIPEKEKAYREFLRAELLDYGFVQLQKSVWISPFKVAEDLRAIIEDRGIDQWVKLMVSEMLFDTSALEAKYEKLNK